VLTCAHVVNAVGGQATVKINDTQAIVVALGSEDGIDLAVLRVLGLDRIPLSLSVACEKGKFFTTVGFQSYNKEFLFRPLNGILGEQVLIGATLAKLIKAWDLKITDDYQLQPGNSGSPVVDGANDAVVGIVRTRQGDGKKGLAISVEALQKIWQEMPPGILGNETRTHLNRSQPATNSNYDHDYRAQFPSHAVSPAPMPQPLAQRPPAGNSIGNVRSGRNTYIQQGEHMTANTTYTNAAPFSPVKKSSPYVERFMLVVDELNMSIDSGESIDEESFELLSKMMATLKARELQLSPAQVQRVQTLCKKMGLKSFI